MKLKLVLLGIAFALAGCGKNPNKAPANTTNQNASGGNPLTAPVDYLGAVGKAKRSAGTRLDTVTLTQAIQMFHAEEDRYPKDLNELVAKQYLPSLPKTPPGTLLFYNPATGEVKFVRRQN